MNKLKGEMIKMNSRMENVSIVKEIPTYSLTDGLDACKWGVSDLYEEAEKNLRELLTYSGEFRTEWCDCKKELYSFRLWFDDDNIEVTVNQWMDELYEGYDLIDDAMWDLGKQDIELSDEEIEYIRDLCYDSDVTDSVTECKIIERNSTYEQIIETLEKLADITNKELEDYYDVVKNIVSYYLETERDEFLEEINERDKILDEREDVEE
jgi:hypothetical protein